VNNDLVNELVEHRSRQFIEIRIAPDELHELVHVCAVSLECVKLGLERTAEKWGLWSLDDVKIIEGSKHPFIEMTTRMMDSDEMEKLNERLNSSNNDIPIKEKKKRK